MSTQNLDNSTHEYSELVSFIENYSDDNSCGENVFKDIKTLFKAYLMQEQEFHELLADKDSRIEELEGSVADYHEKYGLVDGLGGQKSGPKMTDSGVENLQDTIAQLNAQIENMNLEHGEEKEQMVLEHKDSISELEKEVESLQNTEFFEKQIENLEEENVELKGSLEEM